MKGIEKIKKKIMAEAAAEVKKTRDVAKQEASRIRKRNKEERDAYERRYKERSAALVESYKQKTLAQARLDAKKEGLQKREELIDAFISEVLEELDHAGKAYERLLQELFKENLPYLEGSVTITCAERDVSLVKRLTTKGEVRTSKELSGGLLLEDGSGKRIDESLDAILGRKRDEIRQAVATIMEKKEMRGKMQGNQYKVN